MALALVPFNIPIANYQTGVPLPGATVTVYKTGTVTKASIYDLTGAARANPMTVDASGLAQFQFQVGQICDVVWSLGAYTSPRLMVGGDSAAVLAVLAVTPEMYGAAGDGVTDDKAAFDAALASMGVTGGYLSLLPKSTYYLSTLSVPAGCSIRGTLERPDSPQLFSAAGLATMPGISLSSAGTILLGTNASIVKTLVKRSGMTFPASTWTSFAGNGISLGGDSCVIRDCMVVGFDKCVTVHSSMTMASRYTIDGLWADGKNGIYLDKPSFDSSSIVNCHIYPFSTIPGSTFAILGRPGSGLYLRTNQDDTHINHTLCLGYLKNFDFAGTGAINCGKIWSDTPAVCAVSGQIGVSLGANTTNVTIDDLQIWGGERGLVSAQNNSETVFVGNCFIEGTLSHAVDSSGGEFFCPNMKMQAIGGNGLNIGNNGSHFVVRGYAINVTGSIVSVPTSGYSNFIDVDLKSDPFFTPDGTAVFGGSALSSWPATSASSMNLPANGGEFGVSGTATINTLVGGWGTREILLTFASTASLTQAGNMKLATATFQGAAGVWIRLKYDASISKWVELYRGPTPVSAIPLRGHIGGLVVSNNAVTPNTKLNVSAGEAVDTTVFTKMLSAGATIDITTSGVALGLDTGTRANNTWYHVYLIAKADGTTTFVASTSASAPTYPTGYLYCRRIFSFLTDGSANIVPFLHREDTVHWASSFADIATANMGTTNALYALTVPAGIRTRPIFDLGSSTASVNLLVFDGDAAGYAPGSSGISTSPGYNISGGSAGSIERVTDAYTNTARQVRVRSNVSTAELYAYTRGYVDSRGRYD